MKRPDPCILVIFGASGDLTRSKLVPALARLYSEELLPERFAVLGVARTELSDAAFRKQACGKIDKLPAGFAKHLHYLALETTDSQAYAPLKARLDALHSELETGGNTLFYLSTPPSLYATVAEGLSLQELAKGEGWRRLIVEKPFGHDLASAQKLNARLKELFSEEQLYRIDHYLGKETVQNVLAFRFANSLFEPVWNHHHVQAVEITAAEAEGVGKRGGYYEQAGALRDMVQNHLLQVLGMVAMEPPATLGATGLRNETLKVFQSLRPLTPATVAQNVVRGQYTPTRLRGEAVAGYREEQGVAPDSRTETYVALRLQIDNWRWSGVPFLLRTGKHLPTRVTEVVVHFRPTPHALFHRACGEPGGNSLVLRIQPDEGILLNFGLKVPGAGYEIKNVNMDFHYAELAQSWIPAAYERLLLDCLLGDPTLYIRDDAVEACWRYLEPVQKAWQDPDFPLHGYPAGSWGPEASQQLFAGLPLSTWRNPCRSLSEDGLVCEL
ncbi:MAG: glucose-6-phosphate dehydrogenase [Candidatus Sericytochromatia bacterium]